ncbi:MAG: synthase [Sulfobacillus sp.]|nr:synthase [Sulfobacillus sp.]
MKTCVLGSYPKIPAAGGPSVRTAIQRFEAGKIGPRDLYLTYRDVTERVLALARTYELDMTTDGQIRWNDLLDPLTRDIDNLRASGLLRLFDNNFYYRHPVITGRLQFQGGTLAAWVREAVQRSSVPVMVALPGPFTVLALSEDQSYHDSTSLLQDLVEVLALEAESLAETGIVEIQWDEPALATGALQPTSREVAEVYRDLTAGARTPMAVALYWGRSTPWLDAFQALPLSRLSVDLVHDAEIVSRLADSGWPTAVGLGVFNAREVRLEDSGQVAKTIEPVLRRMGSERVWVHPNSGLELLPPDRAEAKLARIQEFRRFILGQEG